MSYGISIFLPQRRVSKREYFAFLQECGHLKGQWEVFEHDPFNLDAEEVHCCVLVDLARDRGLRVVPHLWKTGISIAAAAHLAAATPHCAFIEFLPQELCASALRRELVNGQFTLENGRLRLPSGPGLGVSLNRDALERFERTAKQRQLPKPQGTGAKRGEWA